MRHIEQRLHLVEQGGNLLGYIHTQGGCKLLGFIACKDEPSLGTASRREVQGVRLDSGGFLCRQAVHSVAGYIAYPVAMLGFAVQGGYLYR